MGLDDLQWFFCACYSAVPWFCARVWASVLHNPYCLSKAPERLLSKCLCSPFRNETPSRLSMPWPIFHSFAGCHPSPHAQLTSILPLSSCMWKWLLDPSLAENICFNEETEMYMRTHKKNQDSFSQRAFQVSPFSADSHGKLLSLINVAKGDLYERVLLFLSTDLLDELSPLVLP